MKCDNIPTHGIDRVLVAKQVFRCAPTVARCAGVAFKFITGCEIEYNHSSSVRIDGDEGALHQDRLIEFPGHMKIVL